RQLSDRLPNLIPVQRAPHPAPHSVEGVCRYRWPPCFLGRPAPARCDCRFGDLQDVRGERVAERMIGDPDRDPGSVIARRSRSTVIAPPMIPPPPSATSGVRRRSGGTGEEKQPGLPARAVSYPAQPSAVKPSPLLRLEPRL